MAERKKKYYVVWRGAEPGVYESWTDCRLQTAGYAGALFKSFGSREEAERAWNAPAAACLGRRPAATRKAESPGPALPADFDRECLAVDAACSGNPGPMEYRGVYLRTGQQVFHFGPVHGTNNIGEFLAIVHGLALMKQRGVTMPVYSDSRTAIGWVRQKKCRTKLERTPRTEELFRLIGRAEAWLRDNESAAPLRKWETDRWGEVPADFGRK